MILRPANFCFVWGALAAGLACARVAAQMLPPPVDPGVVEIEVTAAGETRWIDADYVPHQVGSLRSVLYRKMEHGIGAETKVSYVELDANYEFTPEEGKPVRFTDPDSFTLNWKGGPNVVDYRLNFRGTGILGLREFAVTRRDGTKDFEVEPFISNQAYTMTLAGRDVYSARVLRPYREAGVSSKSGPKVVSNSPRFQNRPWGWRALYSDSNGWRNILPHAFRAGLTFEGRDSTSFHAYRYLWINNRYSQESFGTVTITETGDSYTQTPIPLQPAAATATLGTKDWTFVGEPNSGSDPTAHFAFSPEAASASKLHYQLSLDPGLARKIVWAEVFTPEGGDAPTDYRFKSEYVSAEATETASHLLDPFSWRGSEPGTYTLLTFDGALAVDFNRDGVILTAANPLTPHLIDNADQPDPDRGVFLAPNLIDNDEDQISDATDNKVNGPDDLAEFIPVYLDLKHLVAALPPENGFAYKLKHADAAMNFVFTNLMWSNAHTYQDGLDSGFGPDLSQPAWEAEVTQITPGGVDIFAAPTGSTAFLDMIRNQSGGVILVEARQTTRAPLVLTVEKNGQVIVELQLQFEVVGPSLAVDLNRDGIIKLPSEDATDTTSAAHPYRFWSNDDDDDGDMGGDDITKSSSTDAADTGLSDDGSVDGTRDLIDFFPVYLDIKQLLTVLPPSASVKYKLKQADSALNFVYTNLTRDRAFAYHKELLTTGFSDQFDQKPGVAATHRVTAAGVELSTPFLTGVKDNNWGVVLIEGRMPTTAPLVLAVEKDGATIAEVKLELRLSRVEDMFRHVDLTGAAKNYNGSASTPPEAIATTRTGDPSEPWPDSLTNGKYFVFVHGYNVDGQKARGWNCEVFKRMHVLGSKARFVGVTWHGATGRDYHKAVYQAFQTGDAINAALNFTGSADVTIAAHSLGNMVVSHAIQGGGYSPSRYYMINAAVPIEAYDLANVDAAQRTAMVEDDWKNRPTRFYAANWHQLFGATSTDHRNELSWKNRFRDVPARAYNFYSPGEDVVANVPETDTAAVGATLLNQGFNFTRGAWRAQELVKGVNWTTSLAAAFMERGQGGWDSDLAYLFTSHASITNEQLKTRPFFDEFKEDDLINADPAIASAKAGETKVQYDLLARGLPALSYAAAANLVPALGGDRNFNMEIEGRTQNQWPSEGHTSSTTQNRWLHSDFKNAALPYVYQMYEAMIAKGSLK